MRTGPPEDTGFLALMASADVLVMGRSTYDAVIAFPEWPYAGTRVVVMTHRPLESKHGEERFEGDLTGLLEQLAQEGHQHVYLDGGDVVQQGFRVNRVTDLTLSWLPIVLGSGVALFERGLPERRWRLVSSRSFPSGSMQATYGARASGNMTAQLNE